MCDEDVISEVLSQGPKERRPLTNVNTKPYNKVKRNLLVIDPINSKLFSPSLKELDWSIIFNGINEVQHVNILKMIF